MRTPALLIALLTLLACGGSVPPTHPPDAATDAATQDAAPSDALAPDAADGACWRCADRAWRNVCVVPAERAPDSESCLHCGEHCVSDPPDAVAE